MLYKIHQVLVLAANAILDAQEKDGLCAGSVVEIIGVEDLTDAQTEDTVRSYTIRSRTGMEATVTEQFFVPPPQLKGSEADAGNSDMQVMSVRDALAFGVIQEVNRLLLHRAGMALMATLYDDDPSKDTLSIVCYPEDPEGVVYSDTNTDVSADKALRMKAEIVARLPYRGELLGNPHGVQSIKGLLIC